MRVKNTNGRIVDVADAFTFNIRDSMRELVIGEYVNNASHEHVEELERMVGLLIGMLDLTEDQLGQLIGYEWTVVDD